MPFQIMINIIIAVLWMFLSETYTFSTFFSGYLIGILLLLLFDRMIPDTFYLSRLWKFVKLLFLFSRELITANLQILRYVYKPKLNVNPAIFSYEVNLRRNWEITLLANLITMTPGTLTVAVSADNSTLFIHVMDEGMIEDNLKTIENTFERTIKEVTR